MNLIVSIELKRMESSVHSFLLTVRRIYDYLYDTSQTIEAFMSGGPGALDEMRDLSDEAADFDEDDQNTDFFTVGKKVKIDLQDMDYISWKRDIDDEFDGKVIEAIARQNPHKLVFLLVFEGSRQLALYHGKLYRTPWMDAAEVNLKPQGFSLDEIWDSFVEQIALYEERAKRADSLSVDERLALQEQILKLEKLIAKTEAAAWKEPQPKKQFELYSRLREYKIKLEEIKR